MELIPVDPKSTVYKDLMAVNQAAPGGKVEGTMQLEPVDPKSPVYRDIMTGKDIADRMEANKLQRGTDLTPTPIQPKEPLWIEKHGLPKPPGTDLMNKITWPVANAIVGMSPLGRTAKAVAGGGMAAAEDISRGEMPTLGHVALGVGSSLIPEGVVQGAKWAGRTLAKTFGKAPLREGGKQAAEQVMERAPSVAAANAEFATTKNIPRALPLDANSAVSKEANAILTKGARQGIDPTTEGVIQKELTDIGTRVNSGQPLSYGDVFARARHMNDMAKNPNVSSEGRIALYKMHDAYMADLAKQGPEAAQAVQQYKLARRAKEAIDAVGTGSKEAVGKVADKAGGLFTPEETAQMKAIAQHVGPEWRNHFVAAARMVGMNLPTGVAPGVIMSALVRLPGGAGTAIARSLVSPEGTISKNVAPAIGMAVRSYMEQEKNGNN